MNYHQMNREHIKSLHEEGWTDAEIADEMKHSVEWVRKYCKEAA